MLNISVQRRVADMLNISVHRDCAVSHVFHFLPLLFALAVVRLELAIVVPRRFEGAPDRHA